MLQNQRNTCCRIKEIYKCYRIRNALQSQMKLQMDYLCVSITNPGCASQEIWEIHFAESEKYVLYNQRNTCCRIRNAAAQIQVVHRENDPTERGWRAERNSSDGVLSLFSDTRICGNRAPGCVTTHASRGFGGNCVMRASTNRCVKIGGGSNTRLVGATSLFLLLWMQKNWKKYVKIGGGHYQHW